MKKKVQVWLPLLFSITMIIGMYFGYKMRDNMPGKSFFFLEKRRPVQEIMDLINNRYVDDVKIEELADTAILAMLSKLDPHSVFIPANELQTVNEELAGKFFGIGIEFNIYDDTLNVINVLKDGPGFKAGLITGDKFTKVDDSTVAGNKTDANTFRNLLRGSRGEKVKVTFLRNLTSKTVTIVRDAIPITSVDASYMIDKETGFIRLNKFSTQTYREFMIELEKLNKAGMKKLILDLRGNGGGILDEAVEIADEFLTGDKLITYTEGKHVEKKEYRCRRTGQFETGALVVLADEGTASASEVLIGALQDWDRATIIGRRTFGKGLVQEQFDLSDKSALRLTIARYYTPLGRGIQRSYTNGGKAYYDEIASRRRVDTTKVDTVKAITGKMYKTKNGKLLYGGDGINPDVLMDNEITPLTKNTAMLYNKGTVSNFAYHYYLDNKVAIEKYKNSTEFITNFTISDEIWKQFEQKALKDSIVLDKTTASVKTEMSNFLKASIARLVWRNEGYFEALNKTDRFLMKAIEILEK